MKEPVELQDNAARALRMLGQAVPPEGMEARVIERMRRHQAESSGRSGARRDILLWGFGFAVAGMVAMVLLATHHRVDSAIPAKRAAVELPQHPEIPKDRMLANTPANLVQSHRSPRVDHVRRVRADASMGFRNPPPLPMTQQERLLVTLARTPQFPSGLGFVTTSETVVDHGLGENTIFEFNHQELTQLKTTYPGDNE